MGKKHWKLKHLIGSRYGSRFEGSGREGVLVEKRFEAIQKNKDDAETDKNREGQDNKETFVGEGTVKNDNTDVNIGDKDCSTRDNRSLVDDNTAQRLDQSVINGMKQNKTLSGKDIVDALVKNSSTYQSKTVFSQEKYRYVVIFELAILIIISVILESII